MVEGPVDGSIDATATDHAPHSADEEERCLSSTARLFGIVGPRRAFRWKASIGLVHPGASPSPAPSRVALGELRRGSCAGPGGSLAVGAVADTHRAPRARRERHGGARQAGVEIEEHAVRRLDAAVAAAATIVGGRTGALTNPAVAGASAFVREDNVIRAE